MKLAHWTDAASNECGYTKLVLQLDALGRRCLDVWFSGRG